MPLSDILDISISATTSKTILDTLLSSGLQEKLFPLKIFMVFCLAIFFGVTIYLIMKTNFIEWWKLDSVKDFLFPQSLKTIKITKRWIKIRKSFESKSSAQRKLALIKAYSLIEEILQKIGEGGNSLEEKIRSLSDAQVSNLTGILSAEKICRDILRDPDYFLEKKAGQEVLEIFEQMLRDIELF